MSSQPKPSEADSEAVGPRVYGAVDVLRADRIAGWAIDRADSRASVEIDIRREGRLIGTARADRPRKDLVQGGVGTGQYGFVFDIAPPLEPGFEFTVSATARTADGTTAELKRPGSAGALVPPERRIVERLFEEVVRLGHTPDPEPAPPLLPPGWESLPELVARLEVTQARIEATLAALEPPASAPQIGLRILLGIALAVGLGSFFLGIYSMLQP